MADPVTALAAADPLLMGAATYLGATVLVVPLFKRFGLGSILGYLAAGALVGPFALGLLQDIEAVRHGSEFGVVLLLFVIGLELQPKRLWRLRAEIFGLGLAQVTVTGAVLAGIGWLIGGSLSAALIVGLALALSSTAFGVQILRDRKALSTPYGDRAFSILLFQDIAVVPLLALTTVVGGASAGMDANDAYVAIGALVGLVLVGHYGLKHVFRLIALVKADEVFTAAALLVVALAALAMQWAGLSMALGAFIAGVLLAGTEFRHQLESDIEPFRALFLGLFFVGVGMSVDWQVAAEWWWLVGAGAILLFTTKMGMLYGLTRILGSKHYDALRIGATLGQAGEFGFVVFALAASDGLISAEEESILTIAVAISMALTPFVVGGVERQLARAAARRDPDMLEIEATEVAPSKVIVAGFGRFGQVIARIMRMRGYSVTLIDNAPRRIRLARTFGSEVFYGDATKPDVMKAAGAETADAIFYCINDREGATLAVQRLKQRYPHLTIFAAAYDRFQELELRSAGADHVIRETRESAISLAAEGLKKMGDEAAVDEIVEEFRRRDEELLRLQAEHGMEEGAEKMRQRYSVN
ncbi:potassium transporter [Pikeienuella piscinae]|uniref:Potassium transporter n=1 Tax=Pikeienuella piscinae TaxID=2748098 RepID=A0A7L5C1L9_9RHOB|nr:monovalent cation:proton antiporter-2 (CPA2) family protein [Pikeienuella piscinae]QIE57028.1 potassium transporter [Pikeienuella piscinae]